MAGHAGRDALRRRVMSEPTVPCGICGTPTAMTGTKRCDPCWEMETKIVQNPILARKILDSAHPRQTVDLRTALASQAMSGLLANRRVVDDMSKAANADIDKLIFGIAVLSVKAADALISQLNKTQS